MSDSPARFLDLCIDAADHQALADWWCAAMGYTRRDTDDRDPAWPVAIVDPSGAGPRIWVNPVPEAKTVKNRVHHDVVGDTEALLASGATLVRRRDDEVDWDVLADPEGNEFCVFAPE
jgi:hypothetical protein